MSEQTLFTNATLIDGTGAPAARSTSVLVLGSRIQAVGAEADALAQKNPQTDTVDCTGHTIIPGLIDTHVHVSYFPNPSGPMGLNYSVSLEENTIRAIGNAATYLCNGFTTVMDVGTRGRIASAVRDAVDSGLVPGPRIRSSGQVISSTGGLMNSYPSWVTVVGGNGAPADDEVAIRREVRKQSIDGIDNIKLGVTGQMGTNARDWLLMSQAEIAIAVDEAQRRRLTVAAHAYGTAAVSAALKGGVTTLHHAFAGLTPLTLDLLAESSAYLAPTAMVFIGKEPSSNWIQASVEYFEQNIDAYEAALNSIATSELSSRVIVGSDSGISNPTATTAREIVILERYGFSTEGAIRAATGTAAQALGLGDSIGTVEAGKVADLCVVRGELTDHLGLLEEPGNLRFVIKEGRVEAQEGALA